MEDQENKINVDLIRKLNTLTEKPGIYQFKNSEGKIIYIGKAKNLKKRVRQYFTPSAVKKQLYSNNKLSAMLSKVKDFEIISTDSEIEALLLEQNLIKKYKPRYNINLKDDKTFPYIVITNEPFPRVFPTRNKKSDKSKYFGPYTDVKTMKYSLKILRDIFMIRTCNLNITEKTIKNNRFKICLEYHINKCGGPCEGFITKDEYNSMIKQVSLLLNGKVNTLLAELEGEMNKKSKEMKFEEAAVIRDKINALRIYTEKQKIIYENQDDIDVFAVEKIDDDACGMILKIRDGKAIGKSHYYFSNVLNEAEREILEKFIIKYYLESDFIPEKIIIPSIVVQNPNQINIERQFLSNKKISNKQKEETSEIEFLPALYEWLNTKYKLSNTGKKLKLIIPTKGDDAKLVSMVKANAKLMLEELLISKTKKYFIAYSLESLKRDLMLDAIPRRIECFDISHIQGSDMVGSMVVFQDAKPRKSEYRKYKIHNTKHWGFSNKRRGIDQNIPDDYAAMREVIYRRFSKVFEENSPPIPDLIIIDGGKGQLNAALKILKDLGLCNSEKKLNIIALAKRLEEIYLPDKKEPFNIPKSSSSLKLLQKIRNEAHRFAITFHKSLREKGTIKTELLNIKGIGRIKAKKLLKEFGSVENIKNRIFESHKEIEKLIGKKATDSLREYFIKQSYNK